MSTGNRKMIDKSFFIFAINKNQVEIRDKYT